MAQRKRKFGKTEKIEKSEKSKKSGKSSFSIKYKMILGIGIPLLLVLSVIGTVLSSQITSTVETLKKSEIKAETKIAREQVNAFFQPFFATAKQLADVDAIYALMEESDANPSAKIKDSGIFYTAMNELQQAKGNSDISVLSISIASTKGKQLVVSDGSVLENYETESRGWYQQLKAAGGKEILSAAYVDAITGKMVVTIGAGIEKNGELIGAIAVDIGLDGLTEKMGSIVIGEEGFVTVYDSDGYILYHPVSDLIMTHMDEVGYNTEMYNALAGTASFEAIPYQRDGGEYYGAIEYMDDIGWNVMGCMSRTEFLQEVNHMTRTVVMSFVFCALLLMAITIVISLTIVRPLQRLDGVA